MNLKFIYSMNPWWKYKNWKDYDKHLSEVTRIFERKKIDLSNNKKYLIKGLRRTGKTTYLKWLIKELIESGVEPENILYLQCDFFSSPRELSNIIKEFTMGKEKCYIFIDEITFLKDWELTIKSLIDLNILKNVSLVITGSNPLKIKEFFPGRGFEGGNLLFKPLSFRQFFFVMSSFFKEKFPSLIWDEAIKKVRETKIRNIEEFKKVKEITKFYEEIQVAFNYYIKLGGLPGVINDFLINKKVSYKRYEEMLRIIFSKDISVKKDIIPLIYEIIKRYGTHYNLNHLVKDTGISLPTIKRIIDELSEIGFLNIVYATDFTKILQRGDKKIFFSDPFLYYASKSLLGLAEVENSEELGKVVEGIVSSHLKFLYEIPFYNEEINFLHFYYDKSKEIDFVVDNKKIEVKYRENAKGRGDIILTKEEFKIEKEKAFLPVSLFLVLIEKNKYQL